MEVVRRNARVLPSAPVARCFPDESVPSFPVRFFSGSAAAASAGGPGAAGGGAGAAVCGVRARGGGTGAVGLAPSAMGGGTAMFGLELATMGGGRGVVFPLGVDAAAGAAAAGVVDLRDLEGAGLRALALGDRGLEGEVRPPLEAALLLGVEEPRLHGEVEEPDALAPLEGLLLLGVERAQLGLRGEARLPRQRDELCVVGTCHRNPPCPGEEATRHDTLALFAVAGAVPATGAFAPPSPGAGGRRGQESGGGGPAHDERHAEPARPGDRLPERERDGERRGAGRGRRGLRSATRSPA